MTFVLIRHKVQCLSHPPIWPKKHTVLSEESASAKERYLGVFRYSGRAVTLVWSTSPFLTVMLAILTVTAGLLPAGVAWVGQLIVDGVLAGLALFREGAPVSYMPVLMLILLEGLLVGAMTGAQRGIAMCQALLRALLGQRVNELILEKALTLEISQFEDSEFYDKLSRARREASSRPLSLVNRTFSLFQQSISLVSFGALLIQFSPWAVILLIVAGLPSFVAETKFSGDAFRLFRMRAPESRMQLYLETVMAREDHAKEVQLFQLGKVLLERYRQIFRKLYSEDRALTLRRETWGAVLSLVSTGAVYGAYAWIATAAMADQITLGEMTMYLLLFKQGQTAVASSLAAIGGMYEDNLYLSNLYEYLEQQPEYSWGNHTEGPDPADGVRFEDVSFSYPGSSEKVLSHISLHVRPGQSLALVGENGAGKSTMIKLLSGLYQPDEGRILLHGRDIREWDPQALRRSTGVIFQDFNRYQFTVGENIGAGDIEAFDDRERWRDAAEKGMAARFINTMDEGFATQLGRWFKGGKELSTGQWQKIALSRAFMRSSAQILILDEPTASMDAAAEADIFKHFRDHTRDRISILISHRFSTVRQADLIAVIEHGRVIESGTHKELLDQGGRYAHLFRLQAAGYQ